MVSFEASLRDSRSIRKLAVRTKLSAMRVAAIQLEPEVGNVAENLRRVRALAQRAAASAVEWIVLPEFFATGMAFLDRLADAALPVDGAATQLMQELARSHRAFVCGSFICRDRDGENRNAWLLVGPDGAVVGRHDKDLPTMWENCFYVEGADDGVLEADGLQVGAALCWELMRSATVRRLRDRVDLVLAGSAWWSIPQWLPLRSGVRLEAANARTAISVAPALARALGVPVVHAAHCAEVRLPLPLAGGLAYRGHFEGGTCIVDARGGLLAHRSAREGPGVVVAEVTPGRLPPTLEPGPGRWLHHRGAVPTAAWHYQRLHGRRWYRRHCRGRPALQRSLQELIGSPRVSSPVGAPAGEPPLAPR